MFELDKWYFDLITNDGGAFIGYAAALRWRRLRVGYESFLFPPATGGAIEHTSVRGAPAFDGDGGVLHWESHALELSGTWERESPSIRRQLLGGDRGSVDWACHQPRSRARVRLSQQRVWPSSSGAGAPRSELPSMLLPVAGAKRKDS